MNRQKVVSGSDWENAISCLQKIEYLWFSCGARTQTSFDVQVKCEKLLSKCFDIVQNPWDVALHLTRTARDYQSAKPSCLAFFCMKSFAK